MNAHSVSNEILSRVYPDTFHTRTGRKNGVGEAWGQGDSWICNCKDCEQIRRQIWERLDYSI